MDTNIILGKSILTNASDVFSGTLNIAYTAYKNNGIYLCKMPISNTTTTPTLNLNGIGAKTIVTNNGSALTIGDLLINGWYEFMYDSSSDKFLCLSQTASQANNGVKSYVSLFTQEGTDAPISTILYNTFGDIPVWSRVSAGFYNLTLTGAFLDGKTYIGGWILDDELGGTNWTILTNSFNLYYRIYRLNIDIIRFEINNASLSYGSDWAAAFTSSQKLALPKIEVYP